MITFVCCVLSKRISQINRQESQTPHLHINWELVNLHEEECVIVLYSWIYAKRGKERIKRAYNKAL